AVDGDVVGRGVVVVDDPDVVRAAVADIGAAAGQAQQPGDGEGADTEGPAADGSTARRTTGHGVADRGIAARQGAAGRTTVPGAARDGGVRHSVLTRGRPRGAVHGHPASSVSCLGLSILIRIDDVVSAAVAISGAKIRDGPRRRLWRGPLTAVSAI